MDLVQVLPNALKCPCVSIKHALKKQGIKTLKPLISQGFQVSVSILVTQDGCGGRTRTYGLRVMRQSHAQIGVISAPICAFCHHSFGGFSIVFVQPCPLFSHSGSKLGQYGILIFFRKPSIFVAVSSDASVNNPSSVSSGVSKTDLMLTATLAQDAMTVLDSALY